METLPSPRLATARPRRPLPLKSPTAREYGPLPTAKGEPGSAAKCSVPVTEEDRHGVVAIVGHSEIEFAIAIEIGECYSVRVDPDPFRADS